MKSKTLSLMFAFLLCALISTSPMIAQSMDKDNPTLLQSPEISGISEAMSDGYWYKLAAGPGDLLVEMEVVCWNSYQCVSSAQFILYDEDMQEVMNETLATKGRNNLRRIHATLNLQSKQDFLLSITNPKRMSLNAYGTYLIRFKGSIDLPTKENESDTGDGS